MKGASLNARTLRIVLLALLVLFIAGGAGGFYYIQGLLRNDAQEISQLNTEADASEQRIAALEEVKKYLEDHKIEQDKAIKVVSESKQYRYQDEIIDAISTIARKSDIEVLNYTFNETEDAPAASTPQPSTPPAEGASGGESTTPTPGATTPTAGALKSKTVTVTVESPVKYRDFMSFIRRIEQNSTKMQIANVSIGRATGEDGSEQSDSVTTNAFEIEVYVK